jgi:hypothetical protein
MKNQIHNFLNLKYQRSYVIENPFAGAGFPKKNLKDGQKD